MSEEIDEKRQVKDAGDASKSPRENSFAEGAKTLLIALAIALVVRSLFFQPFSIPSSSMKPTLLVGDYLFVTKFSYGYSRHSFPFSPPLFQGRLFSNTPERGDVVVFKLPLDNRTDFIKRVIGLPGDTIQMIDGALYLNGEAVKREPLPDFVEASYAGDRAPIKAFRETLPNGVSYVTLDQIARSVTDNTGLYKVPPGHYFMMGDNRDNSSDSRIGRYVGYVPHENLVGPARFLFFSYDDTSSILEVWKWPWAIRFGRLLDTIR